ncbi:MAG: glycyl-radical enzyme activating protein [Candidatus Aminicenantes bacterium]|nr:glycyl-radical enzyme activating protein [Candidatus Aminicenantes bacterium]
MVEGIIFDIKRYALHDGPGIRTTVFLKGCPLRCQWCHNPEGINPEPEIMVHEQRCADVCDLCISECPEKALTKKKKRISIDRKKCNVCGRCAEACVYDALQVAGRSVTVYDLVSEIEKDRIFFDASRGGVTLSGGEPLAQLPFVKELIREIKSKGTHVTIDTSGYVPIDDLLSIQGRVDLFLFDLKMMDTVKHEHYTGVPNDLILNNLKILSEKGLPVEIRIPLIAGVNDTLSNIRKTAAFLRELSGKPKICLLPYHKGGCAKYLRLHSVSPEPAFVPPSGKRVAKIKEVLSDQGFSVKVGG